MIPSIHASNSMAVNSLPLVPALAVDIVATASLFKIVFTQTPLPGTCSILYIVTKGSSQTIASQSAVLIIKKLHITLLLTT